MTEHLTIGELQARKPAGKEKRVEVPVLKDAQIDRVEKTLKAALERFDHALHKVEVVKDALADATALVEKIRAHHGAAIHPRGLHARDQQGPAAPVLHRHAP